MVLPGPVYLPRGDRAVKPGDCVCLGDTECGDRATAEDLLCDWCRENCAQNSPWAHPISASERLRWEEVAPW